MALKLLRTFIREEKPRAILSLSSIGVLGFATALSCNNTSVSSIVRITSDIFEVHKTQKPFTKRLKLFIKNNIFGRFALKIADKIVLLHDAQKSGLIKAGIDEEKMFTVSQPSTFFESVTERNREDLKLKVRGSINVPIINVYLIFSMISLDSDKLFDFLFYTIKLVTEVVTKAWFIIFGDGDKKAWLETKLKDCSNVIFMGQKRRDELYEYYLSADVLIHPSSSEGLANVILEALYLGVPVVATDSGPITRSLVSNIVDSAKSMSDTLLNRSAVKDNFPSKYAPGPNKDRWLSLISHVCSKE